MNRKDFLRQTAIISGGISLPKSQLKNLQQIQEASTDFEPISGLSATTLHNRLIQLCGTTRIGCAVNGQWAIRNTLRYINASSSIIGKIAERTSVPRIKAGLKIDTSTIQLRTVNSKIVLSGFAPVVILYEDTPAQRIYNQLKIVYDPVDLKIDIDYSNEHNKLTFFLLNSSPKFQIPDLDNQANPLLNQNVVTDNNMTITAFFENQKIILFGGNMIELLDGFVKSMPFPKVIEAMSNFKICPDFKYHFEDDYIYITGKAGDADDYCPCSGADGFQVRATSKPTPMPKQSPNDTTNGFTFEYSRTLTATVDPNKDHIEMKDNLDTPDLAYYYPKQVTFSPFAGSQLRPAVSMGDEGSFLLFKWFYRVSVNIKDTYPVITIDTTKKQLDVNSPFNVLGGAGASLQIGCVYVPLLSSLIEGEVDPSNIVITPTLTIDSNGVALYAKPDYTAKVNIRFHDMPMVDVLLNLFMASFGNNLVAKELRNKVNSLNIKLIDFSSGELVTNYGWKYTSLTDSESVLVAVKGNEG